MVIKKESIKYSLNNLKQRKVRSAFTIISILAGITTIFIFVSFGAGLYSYIEEFSTSSSADKILIQPKGFGIAGLDTTFKLTDDDLETIKKVPGVYEASGIYMKSVEVTKDKKRVYTLMIGYDPKKPLVMELSNIEVEKGRELAEEDNICLGYNYQIEDRIFSRPYSLGEKIEVNGVKIKIVCFFESVGNPQDDAQIYVTKNFMEKFYPDENLSYNWIVAKADISKIKKISEDIEKALRKERDLEKGKEDFFVQSFDDMIETYKNILNIIIGFVILIAFISIIVSAINTANTMITSVLERVKEIGIMKSIGARNSEIFKIFLFESSFLGFIAGVLGVILGFAASFIGAKILENLDYGFLAPKYSIALFAGCILFAIITGAISGVAPAVKAMKINPVKALRYE